MKTTAVLGFVALAKVGLAAEASHEIKDFKEVWFWLRPEEGFYEVDVGLQTPEMLKEGQ